MPADPHLPPAGPRPADHPLAAPLERYYTAQPDPAFAARLESRLQAQAAQSQPLHAAPARRAGLRGALQWGLGLTGLLLALALIMRLLPQPAPGASAPGRATADNSAGAAVSGITPADAPAAALTAAPAGESTAALTGALTPVPAQPQPSPTATAYQPGPFYNRYRLVEGLCQAAEPAPTSGSPDSLPPELRDLPQGVVGGGTLQNGDFVFKLQLACDPRFGSGENDLGLYSEVAGLGIYSAWQYTGAAASGSVVEYAGFVPYVRENGAVGELSSGLSSAGSRGIQFPAAVFADFAGRPVTLRYVVELHTPDGQWLGAALRFTLQPEPGGYRPEQVTLERLPQAERGAALPVNAVPPPFALLAPGFVHPLLGELSELNRQAATALQGRPGWLHVASRTENWAGAQPASVTQDDSWYLLDDQGAPQSWITRQLDEQGQALQVSVMQDGAWRNLSTGESGYAGTQPALALDYGFYAAAAWAVKLGDALQKSTVEYRQPGRLAFNAGVYTIDYGDFRTQVVYDPQTGRGLSISNWRLAADGQAQLQQTVTTGQVEPVGAPPAEVLALFDQPAIYRPRPPAGSPPPPGFDPASSPLALRPTAGDHFHNPSFWFGDLYAVRQADDAEGLLQDGAPVDGYLLGRVDFGSVPGGWCDRSADGSRIAFIHIQTDPQSSAGQERLRWLDLRRVETPLAPQPELAQAGAPSWAPAGSLLALTACQPLTACGLYRVDASSGQAVLLASGAIATFPPLWRPDGSQVAVQWQDAVQGLQVLVVDAQTGQVIYAGAEAGSPTRSWGVTFSTGLTGFGRCVHPK
ncbi:MAG: TolB family protein [Chloroflexota bacterium]